MASTTGTTDHPVSGAPAAPPAQRSARPSLLDDLLRHPRRYTFFQALRILERYCGGEPIGRAGLPRREAIRLRAHAALSFPAWDLEEAEELPNPWRQPETRYRLTVTQEHYLIVSGRLQRKDGVTHIQAIRLSGIPLKALPAVQSYDFH